MLVVLKGRIFYFIFLRVIKLIWIIFRLPSKFQLVCSCDEVEDCANFYLTFRRKGGILIGFRCYKTVQPNIVVKPSFSYGLSCERTNKFPISVELNFGVVSVLIYFPVSRTHTDIDQYLTGSIYVKYTSHTFIVSLVTHISLEA